MQEKQEIIDGLLAEIISKKNIILNQIEELQNALTAETKSSAGDKHETGRAGIHIEQENLGKQLLVLDQQINHLHRIPLNNFHNVSSGSLIKTGSISFFISGVPSKIVIKNVTVYSISMSSEIAKRLLNVQIGDTFKLGNQELVITEII